MKSGFFIPFSSTYKLFWIWGLILLSFEHIIFYELNKHGNWFLTVLTILSYSIFVILIWPHRFFIVEGRIYFQIFPRFKMLDFELRHVNAIRQTLLGISFSYAGKRYHILTLGHSKVLLTELEENDNCES
uniref:Uncharacterized protein n=1 Tax=Lactococcus lactis subsp. cremoris TaxID=1359 RepID=I6SJW4_LACLC|nr:hypothetical protein [Lactococcus cremoris]AFM72753.1 hypothetical protein pAF07_p06 [Lactococcus cremoris]